MNARAAASTALAVTALAGCGGGQSHATTAAAGNTADVDNPWYPLRPGTVMRYRGFEGGHATTDVVTVTRRTELISGVRCAVVRDRVYSGGHLAEDTTDWFAQDRAGTVWYYGEATRELDRHGRTTSTEGSWRAGTNGARPGVIMPAHPRVGYSAPQERFRGHAEDRFRVLGLHASVRVPYGRFRGRALLTREWTPLEPGVIDHKYYVRGIGMVAETTVKGPREYGKLVSISRR
jgi:hypothetical protein